MKGSFIGFITFLLLAFLLCSYSTSARLLQQQQDANEFKVKEIVLAAGLMKKDVNHDFSNLMGSDSEKCHEKDEECLERRMAAEAHLDYIYTQHHKP